MFLICSSWVKLFTKCASQMHTLLSLLSVSHPSLSWSLKISSLYLSLSFLITHKLLSVLLSVFHQPDTGWSDTNTYLFKPEPPWARSYTLAISFHLCTRGFLGLIQEGEIAVACLGRVELWGGSWGPGGKWDCWIFSKCNDAFQYFTSWMLRTVQYFILT